MSLVKYKTLTVALSAIMVGSGCATNGLSSLPLPAPGIGNGGYLLNAVFSNALNLPAHAKVKLAGADVGQLESMVARNYTAVTTMRIMDGVRVPVGSTAELRSATPLGDVFVAIKPPTRIDPRVPLLKSGDTIGLPATRAAATVESVLSSAALLVNGGAVRNFTNIVNGAGKATGDQGRAFGDLINRTNLLLSKLNSRSAQIDAAVTETAGLADRLEQKNQALTDVLQAIGPATNVLSSDADEIADVVNELGATTHQLAKFPSIAGSDKTGRSVIKDANTIAAAWNDVVLSPDTSLAGLNRLIPPFVKSTPSDAISVRGSFDRLVMGSRPGTGAETGGFKGDPAFHGPMRRDWNYMIGSIKYVLWRLQERVVGRGPQTPMGQSPWKPVGPPLPPAPAGEAPPAPMIPEPPR
ncbi:MlaD family protein [Mycobacterium sp. 852002-40037_SCH5390672]|uniref:MlaD family protein n=1 Tax=Mycobacterium sp. 852002-40037_SCH5390672 TaxID=1834089 RepID=UPI000805F360|nr:MlaD family protein [Mycobacterium sp. 852002-40037_SCH5390672]OBB98631.1 mammalian cell entry protein [Mycobacterium sp. 852002-40037_SCH5390672]